MTDVQLPLDRAADLEVLRNFAIAHFEIAFAHLVTAALAGEEWAKGRVSWALDEFTSDYEAYVQETLNAIRDTDTTIPDGAIARGLRGDP